MKIALVLQPWDTAVPVVGGETSIPILNYKLAKCLAKSHEVIIYSKCNRLHPATEMGADGIKYRRIRCFIRDRCRRLVNQLKRFSIAFNNPKRPFFASHIYYPDYGLKIAWDIRKEKCDIVHVYNFTQYIPVIRALNPKCRFVIHMQCEWLTQLDHSMMERRIQSVDLIIGCSEYISEKIRRSFPKLSDRCHTVYNGVDLAQFITLPRTRTDSSTNKLLFVGRVSPEKGIHILIQAFEQVIQRFPNSRLDIVGPQNNAPFDFIVPLSDDPITRDLIRYYSKEATEEVVRFEGEYLRMLEESIPESLGSKIQFHGNIPHDKIIKHYQAADLFIFPSVWEEPFGIPVVEAMLSRIPVVTTKSGGIMELIEDGVTGLLVERDDPVEMAEAIITVLDKNPMVESMVKAAHERATKDLSLEPVMKKLISHYRMFLPNQRGG